MPQIEVPAVRFTQGGRTAYAASPTVQELLSIIPERVNPRVIEDANRRLFENHGKAFGDYLWETEDWVSGALLLGADEHAMEFTSARGMASYGKLRLSEDIREHVKLFDGQHRRYGVSYTVARAKGEIESLQQALETAPDPAAINEELADAQVRLTKILGESIPVIIYEESNLTELQQMFADISHVRTPDPITVARFDRRNPFNLAAYQLAQEHHLLKDRVEMEKSTLSPKANSLITLNQLGSVLAVLFSGIGARRRGSSQDADGGTAKLIYERGQQFFADIEAASEPMQSLAQGELAPIDIRQRGTLVANVTILKALAGMWYELVVVGESNRDDVVEFFRSLPTTMKDVKPKDVWAKAGVINPSNPNTPVARAQELRNAVKMGAEAYAEATA
jgi:hypothetical protein